MVCIAITSLSFSYLYAWGLECDNKIQLFSDNKSEYHNFNHLRKTQIHQFLLQHHSWNMISLNNVHLSENLCISSESARKSLKLNTMHTCI